MSKNKMRNRPGSNKSVLLNIRRCQKKKLEQTLGSNSIETKRSEQVLPLTERFYNEIFIFPKVKFRRII